MKKGIFLTCPGCDQKLVVRADGSLICESGNECDYPCGYIVVTKLIAAAPELLRAAQRVIFPNGGRDLTDGKEDLYQAILKATGKEGQQNEK